jgi:hypothetical protein
MNTILKNAIDSKYFLAEKAIKQFALISDISEEDIDIILMWELEAIIKRKGVFAIANLLGVLVNNSSEDFMVEWIAFCNKNMYRMNQY